ncbi:hypothetical protein PAPYR_8211 [Paratrimastix pyriformis]|uniref:TmcB/TmcC TPR repeats domain-containing protein n=1 Tax=Paratrimastix pyriformis TaxID=342808 RepID=A0ABQ8UDW5_9EUKA|nr:hypothetical protein PAPYR_8211 [Paratrimastix pyriformis]
MNPNRGEDWLSRLERGVFGIFFLLRVDSPLPRAKALLWVINALQVFFLTVTVPSSFSQTAWFSIPRSLLDFSLATTTTAMYVNFGVWSFLLVVFSTSALLLGVFFQPRPCEETSHDCDFSWQWPLRISRAFWFLFTWVLFVPALGALMDILDCRYGAGGLVTHDLFPELACWGMHAVPSAVALVLLAASIPATAACALLSHSRHGFDEHSRGRYDLLVVFCKGLLVVAMRVLTVHHELRAITALATTALMTGAALLWMPYRGLLATVTYVCLYWVCFLGALESALLWFALPQFASSWVPFVGLLGAAALTVPLVAWLTVVRYRRAVALSMAEVRRLAALPIPGAATITTGGGQAQQPRSAATATLGPHRTTPGVAVLPSDGLRSPSCPNPNPSDGLRSPSCPPDALPTPAGGPVGLSLNPAGVGLGPDQALIGQGPAGPGGAAEATQPTAGAATVATPLATSLLYLQLPGVAAPEQVVARCRWAPAVEWATRFLRWEAGKDPRLVSYADAIFSKGISRFPASHGLLLNYAEFLQTAQRNTLAAITAVRRAAGLVGAALDTRFAVYAAERDYESQSSGTEGGLRSAHVMSMLTLRRSMRQAQLAHKRAKNHVRRVWAYLLRPKSDVRGLPPLLDSAVIQANVALEAYSSLLQSFPTSVPLLRGYGSLLQDLYGDIELAESLFAQADQLEEDNRACPGEETGSVHSALPLGANKGTRAALDAGSHKAPSMGRVPGAGAGAGAGGSRLSSLDNGAMSLARQSVVSFLVNRHGAADELDEAAEGAGSGALQGAHSEIASRTGWLLFAVHILVLALCAAFAAMQYDAITTSFETGVDVHAIGNCSVLAERIAYEGARCSS